MQTFRCKICGEAYIGNNKPSHCPFCGAHDNYLLDAILWKEENIGVEICDKTREYLNRSLELELNNTAFYKCISKKINDPEISGMFKFLSKVEHEHASVVKKLLGLESFEDKTSECFPDASEDLKESMKRESSAVDFYKEIIRECPEPRVKAVFAALTQIETDHFNLAKNELEKISK